MNKLIQIILRPSFGAAFITQFLGAFNDNIFRASMAAFVMYQITSISEGQKAIIASVAVGLFMLPFFLFSSAAGELADKYRKDLIIKIVKFLEIFVALFAILGFYLQSPYFLLAVLFLMGTHSTFFGPVKYSILPDLLKEDELIAGNGLFEAGTYTAILLGTILGGILTKGADNILAKISAWILGVALCGFAASLFVPKVQSVSPDIKINKNIFASTWKNMKFIRRRHDIFLCVLGISWFWLLGALMVSQMPALAKTVIGGDETVFTFVLTLFSCGIGLGSIVCQFLLKGKITSKFVPVSALIMTLFLADLSLASGGWTAADVVNYKEFISVWRGQRITLDLFLFAFFGGIYIVPLNTMLQVFAGEKMRSRIIATGNIINSLFMVAGSIVCAGLLAAGLKIPSIFAVIAFFNFFVAVYICGLLPEHTVRNFAKFILERFYEIKVKGFENFENTKINTVIIANHTSFLDAVLLWIYLEGRVHFAIDTYVARKWWIKPVLHLVKYFPIDPTSPMAVKSIIDSVQTGHKVVIFPEGRITMTGGLMKIYPGPAMIADKSNADILPIYIEGSQYSLFSRFGHKFKTRPDSAVTINIMPPTRLDIARELKSSVRRAAASRALYDIMCKMKYESANIEQTIFDSVLDAYYLAGRNKKIIDDLNRKPLSFGMFLAAVFTLGGSFKKGTEFGEYVGFMLPNATASAAAFFALTSRGRVPCMLNFSSGVKNILSCCKAAKINKIFTSRDFVTRGGLEEIISAISSAGIEVKYLEDYKKQISFADKIAGWLMSFTPRRAYKIIRGEVNSANPVAVLFTSGSEGVPKGVALSHQNIQANCVQLSSIADFGLLDSFFNAMPVFHSFGLTGGMLLPLTKGIKVFMYPSPLHYRIIPELVYDRNCTVMFGTDTFLGGYAKVAHPYDFYSVRFIVAGAEKLKEETYRAYTDTFGVRVLEGYGATETAPALSLNTPMFFRRGSVGRFLPGIEYKLQEVPGITDGKRLFVKGKNIMLGYLKEDKPGVLQPLEDGWYDTGDIVDIDADGFIFIKGRAKRFAKIAGEMVSLAAVEETANKIWPEGTAAINIPDDKKGEQIILFTARQNAGQKELAQAFREQGLSELWIPKEVRVLSELPLTGTGKTDYMKLKELI
ncbi:MAG: acyl-[ACP]--phospholipid O-acyltransferase [Elusimicrobiota bacterium]|jgi:acyl-[acyl-carrier-protein]-phospholipid O-acyltransferase/long-chain-fatty-acid--[acyl-carrier-protein] ligase|nr:acyl-[ACP]--phospholipid O-acyltransferase [Elusimicrobiota bacterium]